MLFNRPPVLFVLLSLIGMLRASDLEDNVYRDEAAQYKANQLRAKSTIAANTAYNNRVDGNPYNNRVDGNPYNNRVDGNPYNNGVDGNPYNNKIDGNPYNNRIDGNPYNNRVDGNPYNNRVDGNPYNNRVDGNPYNNRVDGNPYNNRIDGNPYNNRIDGNPYNNRVVLPPPAVATAAVLTPIRFPPRPLPRRCQTVKFEHPVITKKYSDSTGYWVLYTQILETRNVANHCHRNEYVYLAHRQKAGWFWNPRITSLVHYSLGEPKFISRLIRRPDRPLPVVVNMSRNYASSSLDLDSVFPKNLAKKITRIGSDDGKWSETARTSLPTLQMDTAYFQTVLPRENSGSERLKILRPDRPNIKVLE